VARRARVHHLEVAGAEAREQEGEQGRAAAPPGPRGSRAARGGVRRIDPDCLDHGRSRRRQKVIRKDATNRAGAGACSVIPGVGAEVVEREEIISGSKARKSSFVHRSAFCSESVSVALALPGTSRLTGARKVISRSLKKSAG